MNRTLKKALIIGVSIIALFIISILFSNSMVKSKIEKAITELPQHIQLNYEELKVSSLFGNIEIIKPNLIIKGRITDSVNVNIKLDTLIISDIGYWDYLVNDKLHIKHIELKHPNITYYYNANIKENAYRSLITNKLNSLVNVDNFKISNGKITVLDPKDNSNIMISDIMLLDLKGIVMGKNSKNDYVPFHYDTFNMQLKDLAYVLNEYDNLTVETIQLTDANATLKQLAILTKYTKQELSQIRSVERDHFDVVMDSVVINNQNFGYVRDSIVQFTAQDITIYQPSAEFYRDKLLADNTRFKPLYSKMLRDLNFDLNVEQLHVINGVLEYSERVKADANIATLNFKNLNADITNFSNIYTENEQTKIKLSVLFMEDTPFDAEWSFDVSEQNDRFMFKAEMGTLPAAEMNAFMEPNLRTRFEGSLNKMYFTIDGNNYTSNIDLKINYDNFKVIVMSDKGKEKNRLLTALVNLFVKSDSDKENDNMRTGNKDGVERDQTKSIFNFLWLNIRSGLISAMV